MKLAIGVPDYLIEREPAQVAIRGRVKNKDLPLRMISMDAMAVKHDELPIMRGLPVYAAFAEDTRKLWLHPLPDGEYELLIEFAAAQMPEDASQGAVASVADTTSAPSANTLHLPPKQDSKGRWLKR